MAFPKKRGRSPKSAVSSVLTTPDPETTTELAPEREEAGYRVNGREGPDPEDKPRGGQVIIRMNDDGSADPGTRDSTWKKLSDMLTRTPGAMEKVLGKRAATDQLIRPEQVKPFYSGIGLLNTFLAIRLIKMDAAVAGAVVPYSADELNLLADATCEAVNENLDKCPAWLLDLLRGGGSVALAKLVMVFFQVHAQKFARIQQVLKEQVENRPVAVN